MKTHKYLYFCDRLEKEPIAVISSKVIEEIEDFKQSYKCMDCDDCVYICAVEKGN